LVIRHHTSPIAQPYRSYSSPGIISILGLSTKLLTF
jgi:hypothetical protein